MNIHSLSLLLLFTVPLISSAQRGSIPSRYEDFLTKKIDALNAQKKNLETELKKNRITLNQKLTQEGVESVRSSLRARQEHLNQQIRSLREEKEKAQGLAIKSAEEENRMIRKAELRSTIQNLSYQIKEMEKTENFFLEQKIAPDALSKIKQKRELLTQKLYRQELDLQSLE